MRLHLQITGAKGTGGVAQAVECLLCKCEDLSSRPQSYQKKKKEASVMKGGKNSSTTLD
jgi:hypothetical protein